MKPALADVWVYLSATPLLGLTVTLVVYQGAFWIYRRANFHPLLNPVALSVAALVGILMLTGTPYQDYFEGAQFVHFLLGPATVALAFPLYEHRRVVLRALAPMLVALVVGSVVALASALAVAAAFGLPRDILIAIAPKSVTAAVAMGITETLGGEPALTAVLVILTGILGAVMVTPLMNAFGIRDWRARGFAAGLASHGIGTARAFQVHPLAGTFAGIAMGLNALLTALLVPAALALLGW